MLVLTLMKYLNDLLELNIKDILEKISLKEIIKANNIHTEDILYKGIVEALPDALIVQIPEVYYQKYDQEHYAESCNRYYD